MEQQLEEVWRKWRGSAKNVCKSSPWMEQQLEAVFRKRRAKNMWGVEIQHVDDGSLENWLEAREVAKFVGAKAKLRDFLLQ